MLLELIPGAKFLTVMRDPVKMLYSTYWYSMLAKA